mgnify:CR=1 FL=1
MASSPIIKIPAIEPFPWSISCIAVSILVAWVISVSVLPTRRSCKASMSEFALSLPVRLITMSFLVAVVVAFGVRRSKPNVAPALRGLCGLGGRI